MSDRMIVPISKLRACRASATENQPQQQTIGFSYSSLSDSRRSSIFGASKNSWCTNTQLSTKQKEVHDSFWSSVLSRKMEHRGDQKAAVQRHWQQCFMTCNKRRSGDSWDLKFAACLDLLHNSPFTIGGELKFNNTAQIVTRGSNFSNYVCPKVSLSALESASGRSRRDVMPGTGTTSCWTSTEIYQIMVFNFDRNYTVVKGQPTTELMFEESRNPSPIFQHLQSLYCMSVTGEVNVWSIHKEFSKLTGDFSPLKPLLLYNRNVTLVRIMVQTPQLGSFFSKVLPQKLVNLITEPKSCSYYIDKIEKALMSWRRIACPTLSRAQMKPGGKGEIAPYVVHVIDADYQGWPKRKDSSGNIISTGILETCEI